MRRQFAKNLGSNWLVYFVSAVISFFLTPYIVHHVGQAAFGVWILVGSFSGYLGLFDFGIGYAVVRYVARYQKTGDIKSRNEVVATAFYIATGLALLVLAATLFIVFKAAVWFDIPADLVGQSRGVIFLIGLSIAIGFPLSVFSEALSGGLYRFDLFNVVSVIMAMIRAGLTVTLVEIGWGLTGLGAAALAVSMIGYLWRMKMLYRLLPDLSIRPGLVSKAVIRKISDYSFYSFLLVLSGRIAFYSDSFIVGFFKGIEAVAVFGIAVKLVEYLRQLVFTLTKLFSPVASRYDPEMDKAALRMIFYDGSRLNLLLSLPLSLILFFWGGRLIQLWVGDSFSYSIVILQILLLGHLASFTQGVAGEILLGVGRHKIFAILSFAGAVANILLSIILVQKMGLPGVAWGTTIPLILLSIIYLPVATGRLVEGRLRVFVREAVVPAVAACLLPILFVIMISGRISNFFDLSFFLAVAVLIYVPCAWYIGLKKPEREKLRSAIRKG